LRAIEEETTRLEDVFQAQVCLGWIHWLRGEYSLATERLPASIEGDYSQLNGTNKESSGWARVAAIKGTHIKALSQEKLGDVSEALRTYSSALPIIRSGPSRPIGTELRSWIELFLIGFCLVSSRAIKAKIISLLESEALAAFRAWAAFWDGGNANPLEASTLEKNLSRRHVWLEYYITMSELLNQALPFPTTALIPNYAGTSTRAQQRAELKQVEAKYFQLLYSGTTFPRANESNDEVENFVELLMQNWRILCGRSWPVQDRGEGGSDALSRDVLEMLYKCAMKTFHSTAILRHLFTVHLALAEFDLAFKAFDTYLQIVKKGKARVSKTGHIEHGLDDDETVLQTVSNCIRGMCQFGSRQGAERALEIGRYLEDWLKSHHSNPSTNGHPREIISTLEITTRAIATAWRAIGIAQAQWARLTYESELRDELQLRATRCFQKALEPPNADTKDIETVFAFGILLAERRKLAPAIELVRTCLLDPADTQRFSPHGGRFARQRALIPMWHLLALLLSARQEFVTAVRMCEAAFEQFQDPKNLFGEAELNNTRSEHLKLNDKPTLEHRGVVDEMDEFERVNVLEVKMTQLSLIEVLEGPEVAVNACDELLSLYARLFGDEQSHQGHQAPPVTALAAPPRTSGTIRSIKGSIFGKGSRSVRAPSTMASATASEKTITPTRPKTARSMESLHTPAIQVTYESGNSPKKRSSLRSLRHSSLRSSIHSQRHHEKLQKRPGSIRQKDSVRKTSSTFSEHPDSPVRRTELSRPALVDGDAFFTPSVDHGESVGDDASHAPTAAPPKASSIDSSAKSPPHSPKRLVTNLTHKKPLKSAFATPIIPQDGNIPHHPSSSPYTPSPATSFSREETRRRRVATLVKLWLLVAGFYRRAGLYEDAKGAGEEAFKLVQGLEADILKDSGGVLSLDQRGWAGGKSVGELHADVFAEVSDLFYFVLVNQAILTSCQHGYLSLLTSTPYIALANFESALERYADHPSAIIGLSTILLDIYEGKLAPPPAIPPLILPGPSRIQPSSSTLSAAAAETPRRTSNPHQPSSQATSSSSPTRPGPIGLPSSLSTSPVQAKQETTPHPDALTARERAYALLSSLTKLGTGWNNPEAWYALARAHELAGQEDKAREALWWCVEVEEGRGVRGWEVVSGGRGFVL